MPFSGLFSYIVGIKVRKFIGIHCLLEAQQLDRMGYGMSGPGSIPDRREISFIQHPDTPLSLSEA
jgi:hypothetical protein